MLRTATQTTMSATTQEDRPDTADVFDNLLSAGDQGNFMTRVSSQGVVGVEALFAVFNEHLDITKRNHRRILFFALNAFGPILTQDEVFKAELIEAVKRTAPAETELQIDNPVLQGFTQILARIFENKVYTQEFFKNIDNVSSIVSTKALWYICQHSNEVAYHVFRNESLRPILSQSSELVLHLHKKFPFNLDIAHNAIHLPPSARTVADDMPGHSSMRDLQQRAQKLRREIERALRRSTYLRQQQIALINLESIRSRLQANELNEGLRAELRRHEQQQLETLEELQGIMGFILDAYVIATPDTEQQSDDVDAGVGVGVAGSSDAVTATTVETPEAQQAFDTALAEAEEELSNKKNELDYLLHELHNIELNPNIMSVSGPELMLERYIVSGYGADELAIKRNIEILIELKGAYSNALTPNCIESLFAHADTVEKFNTTFNYLQGLRKRETITVIEDLFRVAPRQLTKFQKAARESIETALHENTEAVFSGTEMAKLLSDEPNVTKNIFAQERHLGALLQKKHAETGNYLIKDVKAFLKHQGSWLDGSVLMSNFSSIVERCPKSKDLKKMLAFKYRDKPSLSDQLKTQLVRSAQQFATTFPKERQDMLTVLEHSSVCGWMNLNQAQVLNLCRTQDETIQRAAAQNRGMMATLITGEYSRDPIIGAGIKISRRIATIKSRKRGFYKESRAIKSYLQEAIEADDPVTSQEQFFLMLPYLKKYITSIVKTHEGLFNHRQRSSQAIRAELAALIEKSPVFALVIAQEPSYRSYLQDTDSLDDDIHNSLRQTKDRDENPISNLTQLAFHHSSYMSQFCNGGAADKAALVDRVFADASIEECIDLYKIYTGSNMHVDDWRAESAAAFNAKLLTSPDRILAFAQRAASAIDTDAATLREILSKSAKVAAIVWNRLDEIQGDNRGQLIEALTQSQEVLNQLDGETLFTIINDGQVEITLTGEILGKFSAQQLVQLITRRYLAETHFASIPTDKIAEILESKLVSTAFVQRHVALFNCLENIPNLSVTIVKKLFNREGTFLLAERFLDTLFTSAPHAVRSLLNESANNIQVKNVLLNNPSIVTTFLDDAGEEFSIDDLRSLLALGLLNAAHFPGADDSEHHAHYTQILKALLIDANAKFIAHHIDFFADHMTTLEINEGNVFDKFFDGNNTVPDALHNYFTAVLFLMAFRSAACNANIIATNEALFSERLSACLNNLKTSDVRKVVESGNRALGRLINSEIDNVLIVDIYNDAEASDTLLANLNQCVTAHQLLDFELLQSFNNVGFARLEDSTHANALYEDANANHEVLLLLILNKIVITKPENFIMAFEMGLNKPGFIKALDFDALQYVLSVYGKAPADAIIAQPQLAQVLAANGIEFTSEQLAFMVQQIIAGVDRYLLDEESQLFLQLDAYVNNLDIRNPQEKILLVQLFKSNDAQKFWIFTQQTTLVTLLQTGDEEIIDNAFAPEKITTRDFKHGIVGGLITMDVKTPENAYLLLKVLNNSDARKIILKNKAPELVAILESPDTSPELISAIMEHAEALGVNAILPVELRRELFWNNTAFQAYVLADERQVFDLHYTELDWLRLASDLEKAVVLKQIEAASASCVLRDEPVLVSEVLTNAGDVSGYAINMKQLGHKKGNRYELKSLEIVIRAGQFLQENQARRFELILRALQLEALLRLEGNLTSDDMGIKQSVVNQLVVQLPALFKEHNKWQALLAIPDVKEMLLEQVLPDADSLADLKQLFQLNQGLFWKLLDLKNPVHAEAVLLLPWLHSAEEISAEQLLDCVKITVSDQAMTDIDAARQMQASYQSVLQLRGDLAEWCADLIEQARREEVAAEAKAAKKAIMSPAPIPAPAAITTNSPAGSSTPIPPAANPPAPPPPPPASAAPRQQRIGGGAPAGLFAAIREGKALNTAGRRETTVQPNNNAGGRGELLASIQAAAQARAGRAADAQATTSTTASAASAPGILETVDAQQFDFNTQLEVNGKRITIPSYMKARILEAALYDVEQERQPQASSTFECIEHFIQALRDSISEGVDANTINSIKADLYQNLFGLRNPLELIQTNAGKVNWNNSGGAVTRPWQDNRNACLLKCREPSNLRTIVDSFDKYVANIIKAMGQSQAKTTSVNTDPKKKQDPRAELLKAIASRQKRGAAITIVTEAQSRPTPTPALEVINPEDYPFDTMVSVNDKTKDLKSYATKALLAAAVFDITENRSEQANRLVFVMGEFKSDLQAIIDNDGSLDRVDTALNRAKSQLFQQLFGLEDPYELFSKTDESKWDQSSSATPRPWLKDRAASILKFTYAQECKQTIDALTSYTDGVKKLYEKHVNGANRVEEAGASKADLLTQIATFRFNGGSSNGGSDATSTTTTTTALRRS